MATSGTDPLSGALCWGWLCSLSGFWQQTASSFLAQAVAVTTDCDDMTMVQQAVQDRCRYYGIAKDGPPLADGAIRCHQHCPFLIATAHQLKEQVGRMRLERRSSSRPS